MRRLLRSCPSPALVISCLALGIALGGTSYAAVLAVPNNSVGTSQLKNGAVTTPKLKNAAVTADKLASAAVLEGKLKNDAVTAAKIKAAAVATSEVKNGSLLKEDFASGQLPTGSPGPPGPPGPRGPAGPAGVAGLQRFDAATSSSSANSKSVVVTCPSGKRVVGGGARITGNGSPKVTITENFPDADGDKWNGKANEVVATSASWQLQVYALCATVAS
jgi:hypothetical protein